MWYSYPSTYGSRRCSFFQKDSWTNKTHVVYFLLDLIQWFWPHPEKVHAQEKQSKKRGCNNERKKKEAGVTCCSPRGKDWRIYLGSFLPALSFLLCSFCPGFLSSSPFLFPIMFCLTLPLLSSPTCLPLCHTSFLRLCALYSPTILLPPVILSLPRMLFIHNSSLPFTLPLQILHPPSSTPLPPYAALSILAFLFFSAANVCDEEMLLCQNGGTCYQNLKCICPPEFKGVLCQHSRCEAGKDCSGASLPHPSTATLLLGTLLTYLLATLTPHWATKILPTPQLRPPPCLTPKTCVYEHICEATGDPKWEGVVPVMDPTLQHS